MREPLVGDDERYRFLDGRRPVGSPEQVGAVRAEVTALVVELKFKAKERDRYLFYRGMRHAVWCLANSPDGRYISARDLSNDVIERFVQDPANGFGDSTKATYVSALRILGGSPGRNRKAAFQRNASTPYTHQQRTRLWAAAAGMEDDYVNVPRRHGRGVDAMTMLAVGFGAGTIRGEINYLRADSVVSRPQGALVQVARQGWVRDVPVYGALGNHLRERAAALPPDAWLFRPDYAKRTDAVSSFTEQLKHDYPVFDGFTMERARYRFLIDLLTGGCPFHAVCEIAGIRPGTKRPTDLLPHMPTLTSSAAVGLIDRFMLVQPGPTG